MSPLATPQGVNSPTFNPAPFNHGLSVAGLYEYHSKHSPNHPVFTYADTDTGSVVDIRYPDAWTSITKVAEIVHASGRETSTGTIATRPTIGILALSDSLSYIYMLVAIMSLGYIAFPLSPRNNPIVTAHLLDVTHTTRIFVSDDAAMQSVAKGAIDILAKKGITVDMFAMPQPHNYAQASEERQRLPVDVGEDDVTIILHSSGTTALPKPIPITRRGLVNLSNIPCYGELDLAGKRIAGHTNPMFHAMGLATLIWPLSSGAVFALYKPVLPPIIPTPANFLASWTTAKCDVVFCVPVFVEAWARDPVNLAALRALDSIVFSGASVSKTIGDMLVNEGVTMHPFWGSTEVGPATMFIPHSTPSAEEWEYFKMSNHIKFVMQPQKNLPDLFEPIMIPTDICFPHVTNSELDGSPVFAVGDLLERHPKDPLRWRVFGRKDDQMVLSTAENVNPVPVEAMIAQDPLIGSVVMFGHAHIEPGILVEPAAGHTVDHRDKDSVKAFIDVIWPSVEKANLNAPEYARIKKDMIIVASPLKPFEHTAKGTARRGVCLKLYATEIEALYAGEQDAVAAQDREFPDRV
ncbi:acetyl-CoA synthetase-like protein [Daedaleopsis nitida]|nr:acetyl-CoA synthetase-like protein [Daedaleopsis nitida]